MCLSYQKSEEPKNRVPLIKFHKTAVEENITLKMKSKESKDLTKHRMSGKLLQSPPALRGKSKNLSTFIAQSHNSPLIVSFLIDACCSLNMITSSETSQKTAEYR